MAAAIRLLLVIVLVAATGLAPAVAGTTCDLACLAACDDSVGCEDGDDETAMELATPAPLHDGGDEAPDGCPYGCTACACSGARVAAIVTVSISLGMTTGSIDSFEAPDRVWPSHFGPRIFHPPRQLAS